MSQIQREPDGNMQHWVGLTLRIGIAVSGSVLALGVILAMVIPRDMSSPMILNPRAYLGQPWTALLVQPSFLCFLGILLLMMTPLVRVIMTLVLFIRERDWRYVIISSIVLVIVLSSIVIAFY